MPPGYPRPTPIDRRSFLAGAGVLFGWTFTNPCWGLDPNPDFSTDPFSLGVASGDPLPDGMVLWTRLAPDPLNGGGMPPRSVPVDWEVATDEKMKSVVRQGTALASPALGHSVHVEVRGLMPARWYWYRFRAGSVVSPVGRTRTTPAFGARVDRLTFAFASCQHYEHGYFNAYEHMAAEDLDLVLHLGDYIYEGAAQPGYPRMHNGAESMTLAGYRNRYALYKADPHLKRAHASFPWVVTWDDHEVDNNYADDIDEIDSPSRSFLARRAQAYQAFYEHMPLGRSSLPRGASMLLYRRLRYGDLTEFDILDTRQYRTNQPCGDGVKVRCPEALRSQATLMGPKQERWLFRTLDRSKARWNVIAQQVMIAPVDLAQGPDQRFSMDKWSGYVEPRNRFLGFLQKRRPPNPVVVSGDIHSNWVADLKANFDDPRSPVVGTELVGTSISSGGDGTASRPEIEKQLPENPHVKFFNSQRGYVRCEITSKRWKTDYRVVSTVTKPDSSIATRASFVIESGRAGAERA